MARKQISADNMPRISRPPYLPRGDTRMPARCNNRQEGRPPTPDVEPTPKRFVFSQPLTELRVRPAVKPPAPAEKLPE